MAHLTDLDLTAPADSLYSGGVVLNTWRARIDVLNDALGDITSVEADQVENLGTTTISAAQWVYLGALDQSIISTASVDFGEVDITKTTTLAAGGYGLRCQVTHSTTGMTGTLRGAYIVATNAAFTATGTIRGAEIKARAATSGDVGGNVTTLEGVSISSDAKNKTVTTQRGMEVILDGKSGAAVTLGVGIRIANNYQANIATTSYALQIYRDSFDYTADIQLSGGGLIGGSTGKIKMTSSGVTTFTAAGNLDIGAYNLRAATLTADGLTATRVIFAGASGLLSSSAALTFVTDTLTVTKIGAFQAAGAINFDSQNMTNVDIDSGTIGGVTLDGTIAGGDQAFTGVGDMTFTAGSLLKSGSTNTNTLLLAANDTTFITLTTADPDTCAISGVAVDNSIIGAGTPAALTCTTFTSTGIDDNADANAITISVDEVVSLGVAKLTVGATTPTAAQWAELGGLDTTAKARAYLNAVQENITGATVIRVDLDTESYDPGSNFDVGNLGSGAADGTTGSHLIDSGYDFAGIGVKVGMRVKNTTDTTYTYITAVAEGDLTLRDDIFVSGEGWQILAARFVAPVAGYYAIAAHARFNDVVADKRYLIYIRKNSTTDISVAAYHSSIADYLYCTLSDIVLLAEDDVLDLWVRTTEAGNAVDIGVGPIWATYLAVHFLSKA